MWVASLSLCGSPSRGTNSGDRADISEDAELYPAGKSIGACIDELKLMLVYH